jgi:hypothetical protein
MRTNRRRSNRPLVAGISISFVVFVFSTTCRIIVFGCVLERAADCLCSRLQGQTVCSIQGGSDSLQIWMLILHGSSDIPMPHRPHHRREIAGVAQDPCPRNRDVRNTRRDPQRVAPSFVRCGIASPCPSNDHTVNERKETAIPQPYLRRGPEALRMPDHSSGLFFARRGSCCLARR